MKIFVKIKPNSKQNKLEKINQEEYCLWVKSAPREGQANKEAIKLLSEYLDIAKSRITIFRGAKSKSKIFNIE